MWEPAQPEGPLCRALQEDQTNRWALSSSNECGFADESSSQWEKAWNDAPQQYSELFAFLLRNLPGQGAEHQGELEGLPHNSDLSRVHTLQTGSGRLQLPHLLSQWVARFCVNLSFLKQPQNIRNSIHLQIRAQKHFVLRKLI